MLFIQLWITLSFVYIIFLTSVWEIIIFVLAAFNEATHMCG